MDKNQTIPLQEKRKDLRSDIQMEVNYIHDSQQYKGISKNISRNGIFIETTEPKPENSPISLEFTLPHTTIPINIDGVVVWLNKNSDESSSRINGMGVKFCWKYNN